MYTSNPYFMPNKTRFYPKKRNIPFAKERTFFSKKRSKRDQHRKDQKQFPHHAKCPIIAGIRRFIKKYSDHCVTLKKSCTFAPPKFTIKL